MPSTSEGRGAQPRLPLEIGWREWVELPELCNCRILAKIDTGAKTSAIHAFRLREVEKEGRPHVEFYLHPVRRRPRPEIFCTAPVHDQRAIRSSNGAVQIRFVILTKLRLGGRAWPIELSLASRDEMGFRLLVGRDALRKRAIIHPSRSFLLGA
jgi:hypothetical protein